MVRWVVPALALLLVTPLVVWIARACERLGRAHPRVAASALWVALLVPPVWLGRIVWLNNLPWLWWVVVAKLSLFALSLVLTSAANAADALMARRTRVR
jgi:hypothetical protein